MKKVILLLMFIVTTLQLSAAVGDGYVGIYKTDGTVDSIAVHGIYTITHEKYDIGGREHPDFVTLVVKTEEREWRYPITEVLRVEMPQPMVPLGLIGQYYQGADGSGNRRIYFNGTYPNQPGKQTVFRWEVRDSVYIQMDDQDVQYKARLDSLSEDSTLAWFDTVRVYAKKEPIYIYYPGHDAPAYNKVRIARNQKQLKVNSTLHIGHSGDCATDQAQPVPDKFNTYRFNLLHHPAFFTFLTYNPRVPSVKVKKITMIANKPISGTFTFSHPDGIDLSSVGEDANDTITLETPFFYDQGWKHTPRSLENSQDSTAAYMVVAPQNDVKFKLIFNVVDTLSRIDTTFVKSYTLRNGIKPNTVYTIKAEVPDTLFSIVDLGLGDIKYAFRNVEAYFERGPVSYYGGAFAYGESATKNDYSVGTGNTQSNYNGRAIKEEFVPNIYTNGKEVQGDAAFQRWGDYGCWRLPQNSEIDSLLKKCTSEWTEYNGTEGALITGPSGKRIFLPASDLTSNYWSIDRTKDISDFYYWVRDGSWGSHIVYRKIPILGISKQRSDSTAYQNFTEFYQPGYARGVIEYSNDIRSHTNYDGSLMLLRHIGEEESKTTKGNFTINGMVRCPRPWPKRSTTVVLDETGFIFGTDSATLYYDAMKDKDWYDSLFINRGLEQVTADFDNNIHVKLKAASNVSVAPFVDVNNQVPNNIVVDLSGRNFLGYLDKEKKYYVREYFRMWNKDSLRYDYYYASKATQIKGFFPHTDSIKWVVNEKEATLNGYVVGVSAEVAGKVGFVVHEFDKKDDFFELRTVNDNGEEHQEWFSPADSIYKNLTIKGSKFILADNGENANGAVRPDMTFSAKLPDLKKKYYFVRAAFATFNKDKNGLITDTTFVYAPEVTVLQPLDTIDLGRGVGVNTRWASLNVEAQFPEDHDSTYVWNSAKKDLPDPVITDIGGTIYDIAYRKWYGEDGWLFTMPSKEQMEEMLQNCGFTYMVRFGRQVLKVDGPNGDYMFLADRHVVTSWDTYDYKDLWTSKRDGTQAYYNGDGKPLNLSDITNKFWVRPVFQVSDTLANGSMLFISTDTVSRSKANRGEMTFWGRALGATKELKENYTITRGFVIHDYKGGTLADPVDKRGDMPDTTTVAGGVNEGLFNGLYSVPLSKAVRDTLRSDKDYWYRAYIIYENNATHEKEYFYGIPKKLSPLTIDVDSIFWEVHENKAILGCKTDGTIFIQKPQLTTLVQQPGGELDLQSETTKLGFIVGDSANITFDNYETLWEYHYKENEEITDSAYRIQMDVPIDTVYWVRAYVVSDGMIRYSEARQFGLDYVDLGLPSHRLWANISVGSAYPEDDYDYFSLGEPAAKNNAQSEYNGHSWGPETQGAYNYHSYVVDTLRFLRLDHHDYYTTTPYSKTLTLKVPVDAASSSSGRLYDVPYRGAIRELTNCSNYDGNIYWKHYSGTKNDAAYMNWQNTNPWYVNNTGGKYIDNSKYGDLFVEPTNEEWQELQDVCGWKMEKEHGVPGWRVTGPNGNSLFLPLKGRKSSDYHYDTKNGNTGNSFYWTSDTVRYNTEGLYHVSDSVRVMRLSTSGHSFDAPGDYEVTWGQFYNGFGVRPIARYNIQLTGGSEKLRDDTLAYIKTDTVTYVNYRTSVALQGTYRINYPMANSDYELGFVISDCTDAEKNSIDNSNCQYDAKYTLRNGSQYFVELDNSIRLKNGKGLESDKTYFYRFYLHTLKDGKYYFADADSFHLADHYTKDVTWRMYETTATIRGLVQGIMPAEVQSGLRAALIVSYKRDLKATDSDLLQTFDLTDQLQDFYGSKGGPISTTFTLPKDSTYYYRLYVYYNNEYHYGDVNLFGYELIDLGLPSGKKWASINVGGGNPLQGMSTSAISENHGVGVYGNEDQPYRKAGSGSRGIKGSGDAEDWAQTRWHNVYRMPYGYEAQELINNLTWSADTIFGIPGVRGTAANGKSIFFRHSQKYYQGNVLKESDTDYSLSHNYMDIRKSNSERSGDHQPYVSSVSYHTPGCQGVYFERPIFESNILLNPDGAADHLLIRTDDAIVHNQVNYVTFFGSFIGTDQQRFGGSAYNVGSTNNIQYCGFIVGSDTLVTHENDGAVYMKYDFPHTNIRTDSIFYYDRQNINIFKVDSAYWVRAYVKIDDQYYYGRSIKFVRQPNINTLDVDWAVGKTEATLNGSVVGFNNENNISDNQEDSELADMEKLAKNARVGIMVGFHDDLGHDLTATDYSALAAAPTEEVTTSRGKVYRKKLNTEGKEAYFYDLGHAVNGNFQVTVPYDRDTTYFYRAYIYYNDEYRYGDYTNHYGLRFVDLGLPMRWANINVGARFAEDNSHLYSWGDTIAHDNGYPFTFDRYPYYYSTGDDEYNNLGNEIKGSKHDVAHLRWNYTWDTESAGGRGALWAMPSEEDLQMLVDSCTWTRFSSKGNFGQYVDGYKVKSLKTGDSIFVSAAKIDEYTISGMHSDYYGGPHDYGPLWTSSRAPRERNAYGIQTGAGSEVEAKRLMKYHYRYHGHFVRPMAHINVSLPTGRKLSIMTERTDWVAGVKQCTIYGCVLGLTSDLRGTYGFVVGESPNNLLVNGPGVSTYTVQTNSSQIGLFRKSLTQLDNNRMYYFRTFLTVDGRTYYGETKEFGIVMVDLGLKAKWANVNMGSWKPKDHGDYYGWGETTTKDIFTLEGYKYYTSQTGNFRDLGNNISGNDSTDVANKMLGGRWRMASDEEWEELITKCRWEPDTISHIPGFRVWGIGDFSSNSIFLPANYYNPAERDANYDLGTNEESYANNHDNEVPHRGYYWSSNRSADYRMAREILFIDSVGGRDVKGKFSESYRYRGNSIRAVASTNRADRFYMRTDATDWRYENDTVSFYAVILFDENKLPDGYDAGFLVSNSPNVQYGGEGVEIVKAYPSTIGSGDYVGVYRGEPDGAVHWHGNKHNNGVWYYRAYVTDGHGNYWYGDAKQFGFDPVNMDQGLSWANINVDAASPEEIGLNGTPVGKYAGLDPAYAEFGGLWHLPSETEKQQLLDANYYEWKDTTIYGTRVYKVISKANPAHYIYMTSNDPAAWGMRAISQSNLTFDDSQLAYLRTDSTNWRAGYDNNRLYATMICNVDTALYVKRGFFVGTTPDVTRETAIVVCLADSVNTSDYAAKLGNLPVGTYYYRAFIRYKDKDYVVEPSDAKEVGLDFIDLGLPSGVKWANVNIGSTISSDKGDNYAWGETEKKTTYTQSNYRYYNPNTGYADIGSDISANLQYDVTAKLISGTRMPTQDDLDELLSLAWTEETLNGVRGFRVTSNVQGYTDKSIFLPMGDYWTATQNGSDNSKAFELSEYVKQYQTAMSNEKLAALRYLGKMVRPVQSAVITLDATGRTTSAATLNGSVTVDTYSQRGFEYSRTLTAGSLADATTVAVTGTGTGQFSSELTGLTPGALYYYRAYVEINSMKYYGAIKTFSTKSEDTMQAIDLGLSVKWADRNVGALLPENDGDFYAWGDTLTRNMYSTTTYTHHVNDNYVSIGTNISATRWDISTKNFGGCWRMPTKAEMDELMSLQKTTWTWSTKEGVPGYWVESKPTQESPQQVIFMPAAGYHDLTYYYQNDTYGHYWTSSVGGSTISSTAFALAFTSTSKTNVIDGNTRYFGYTIRPVYDTNGSVAGQDVFIRTDSVSYAGDRSTNTLYGSMLGLNVGQTDLKQGFVIGTTRDVDQTTTVITLSDLTQTATANGSYHMTLTPEQLQSLTVGDAYYVRAFVSKNGEYKFGDAVEMTDYTFFTDSVKWGLSNQGKLYGHVKGQKPAAGLEIGFYYATKSDMSDAKAIVAAFETGDRENIFTATIDTIKVATYYYQAYTKYDGVTHKGAIKTFGAKVVDLGLSSGVKWVDMNLGADSEKAFGDKYRWGETVPNQTGAYSVPDSRTYIGGTGYDAAHTRLRGDYRLPSITNIQELIDECNWQWEVNGFRVTSKKNGNSIFLPVGSEGHYWSSQQGGVGSGNANMLEMTTTNRRLAAAVRSTGLMLRPTLNPKSDMNGEGGNAGSGENGSEDVEGNE